MESTWECLLITAISILYSIFVQQFVKTSLFSSKSKVTDIITFLILCSLFGIVLSGMLEEYNNLISKGVLFGSYILIIDTIWSNWDAMDKHLKLCVTGMCLFKLAQYAKSVDSDNDANKDKKDNKNKK